MAKPDEGPKAEDLFEKSTPTFGQKRTFEEAYPQIEDITIEVEGKMLGDRPQRSVYTKSGFPGEHINCGNSLCYGGGYHIGNLVYSVVRDGKTEAESSALCYGYEGTKGKRNRDCLYHFKVKVSIKYKESN